MFKIKYIFSGLVFILPFTTIAQKLPYGDDNLSIVTPLIKNIASLTVDSFTVFSKVNKAPRFNISLDSLQKLVVYPQMESDNLIGGNLHVLFRVTQTGIIDSVWLDGNISIGLNKAAIRFIKILPPMIPARKRGKNVPCVCRLAFHFKVKEE